MTQTLVRRKFNENHDPDNGEFASGGGSSGGSAHIDGGEDLKGATTFHESEHKIWRAGLTKPQRKAIDNYSGDGYENINNFLRDKDYYEDDDLETHIDNLKTAMNPIARPLTVYRGINTDDVSDFHKVGNSFSDSGFVSTSIDPRVAKGFSNDPKHYSVARIHLPKGTKVAYANNQDEQEVVIHPDAKFKVTNITHKGKIVFVDMDYVNEN